MRMLLKDLQPHTLYILQMRTRAGERFSDWSQLFELHTLKDENPPNPVTNLSGTMSEGNLSLFWEAPTHNEDGTPIKDLKDYRVTIQPNPADPEWRVYEFFVETNRADFPKELNVASFGRYRASLTITVQARDLVGNLSAPVTLQKVKPRPSAPTGLTWVNVGNAFSGSWTAPSLNTDGSPFDDPNGYQVRVIYAGTNIKTYITSVPKFDYSYEQNKGDFGGVNNTAKTPLTLEVRARDSVGQLSDPVSLEAGNPPPAKPTGVTATAASDGIRVVWNANPDDDLTAYEIWSAGGAATAGTLYGRVSPSQREYTHQTVAYNQDHYLYVTAVDEFGSRSPESDRSGPVRPKSPFTVDTTPPAATTLTAATATRPTTESAAVVLTWPAVTDSDLAGYHIRYSKNVTTKDWLYHDVIDKAATTTTIDGLASATSYVFQIRSYDTMINPSAWSAEAVATASTSQLKEVATEIQVVAGGSLRSSNFNETNQTGWRLMDSGLDILSGRVNARVVSAGTLISSQTVTHDGTSQPAWSLNLAGNASLNDVQVRGKIVVGNAAGTANAAVNIASHNYGGTGSQWAIKGDGTIDLKSGGTGANSLQIRSDGIFGYDGAGNTRIHMNTAGQFTLATTNGGVRFDDNGIYGYSGATNTFYINRDGAAYFAGQIAAGSGHVGNWNITTNNLYAGNLNMRADLGMIYGGDTTARVAMRSGYGFWAGNNEHHLAPFRVSTNGYIYSVSGNIGGFEINGGSGLYSGGGASRVMMQPGAGFWAGADSRDSSPWYVRQDGYMYARSARVDGTIYASGGDLGNLSISGTLSGGVISGTVFRTNNDWDKVEMGATSNPYGGGQAISFGGRGWASLDGNYHLRVGNWDGLNLSIMYVKVDGGFAFQVADSSTGYGVVEPLTVDGPGTAINSRPLYLRGMSDSNHVLGWNSLRDGPRVTGYSGFDIFINAYSSSSVAAYANSSGQWRVAGGVYSNGVLLSSSRSTKTNIVDANIGLSDLKKLKAKKYTRIKDAHGADLPQNLHREEHGFILDEVATAFPAGAVTNDDAEGGIDVAAFITLLVKSVQELSAEVDALKARLPAKPTA